MITPSGQNATGFSNSTEKDIYDLIYTSCNYDKNKFAMIENVHSFPGQGVASSFKFGRNYGLLLGSLYSSGCPFETVSPQKWQKALGCLTHGDKNISKSMAQRLFQDIKVTHAIADALLIAEYCRRVKGSESGKMA